MKRILLGLVLAVAAVVAVRWVIGALASDETRIRWMVEEMVDGFNEGSARRATSGFAESWRYREETLRRDDLRGGLLAEFQQQRSRQARRLTLRASVPEPLAIEVAGDTARMELELHVEGLRGEAWAPRWTMRVRAELERGEDGWRIVAVAKDDLEGSGLRG